MKKSSASRSRLDRSLAVGLMCLAGVITIFQVAAGYDAVLSTRWPTTEGTVIRAGGQVGSPILFRSFFVEYRYQVNGVLYTNSTVQNGVGTSPVFPFEIGLQNYVAKKYPIGSSVAVHYQPENPRRSILEPGLQWPVFIFVPLIVAIILFAIWILKTRKPK